MSSKGPGGHFHGTTGDRTEGGQHKIINGVSTKLDRDSQGKHVPGHNNYIPGRSVMHGSMDDIQELADVFGGTGVALPGSNRERVDFGKVIGTYVDGETGERFSTTIGTIHYSKKKDSCHIVPARPKGE